MAQKRPVEKNPVEQTFERVDFNRQPVGPDRLRNQKATLGSSGDQTISELAPSSMGTMRTFVQISNQAKPVSHVAIDSDFRNTSSDVDSIESSNATSATGGAVAANQIVAKKKMAQVIEKSAIVTSKVNTYGYQELPTRDQSSHASYSTSSQSEVGQRATGENRVGSSGPNAHPWSEAKEQSYLPPFETITRSKDSVIDLWVTSESGQVGQIFVCVFRLFEGNSIGNFQCSRTKHVQNKLLKITQTVVQFSSENQNNPTLYQNNPTLKNFSDCHNWAAPSSHNSFKNTTQNISKTDSFENFIEFIHFWSCESAAIQSELIGQSELTIFYSADYLTN